LKRGEREGSLASGMESQFDPASHNAKYFTTILRSNYTELEYNDYIFGKHI